MRQYTINRGPLQPGYDIFAEDEKRTLYGEMDFEIGCGKQFHKLSLRSPDEDARDIAVSYMPWPSRNVRVGFDVSEKLQDRYWEAVEKMKIPKQKPGRREYKWTTSFNGEEKTALWITETTQPARYRSYTLIDQKTSETLAEFNSDKTVYMGGMLKIHDIYRLRFNDFDRKVLMTFLAICERTRRESHHTLYRASKAKSNKLNVLCYRTLEFLLRQKLSD